MRFSILLLLVFYFTTNLYAQEKKLDVGDVSLSWNDSPLSTDSIDIAMKIEVKNPEIMSASMEIKYGTIEGAGDLAAFNLFFLKEANAFFLVSGVLKFPINNGYVTIYKSGVEKKYFLTHDKYFSLRLKDVQGKEVKYISRKELQ